MERAPVAAKADHRGPASADFCEGKGMEVRPGYKVTEVGVIPEEWDVKPFTQVTDLITCGIAATPEYVPETRGYPFLSSTNVKDGRVLWSGYKHISTDLHRQLYHNNPPKRGDILYSRVGTFGEAAVVDVDFEFSVYVSLTLIKPKQHLDSRFLMQLLNSDAYKRRAREQIYLGGGVGNLNVDVVRRYPIVLPPFPEQRAIAAALSDVDALLGGLERLIAKKRDLKQAAMQQLLTGQTRLPGFSGEWEVKRLGEIANLYQPETISASKFTESGYPVYGANGVVGHYHTANHKTWQVTVTCRGSTCGTVNRTVDKCWITGNAMVLNCDQNPNIDKQFFYYLLLGQDLSDCITGTGQPQIVRSPLAAVRVSFPGGLPEQTAIAAVLSDMDAELATLEARRDKTRALKQAMMQELLTGKTRLV